MIPGWLQTILLTLLLLFVINKTAHKGLSQWRLERKDRAAAQSADSAQQDPHEGSHHRGVLHEESFHDHSAGSVRGQLDAALQSAISVIDHDLHSIGRYLAAARRRVPGLKVEPPRLLHATACMPMKCQHQDGLLPVRITSKLLGI